MHRTSDLFMKPVSQKSEVTLQTADNEPVLSVIAKMDLGGC